MALGHGLLDYVVVTLVAFWTLRLLLKRPERMLIWLPLFLTIDFFIPMGTQLTPSRFVPFMLGAWLLHRGWLAPPPRYAAIVLSATIVILVSFSFSFVIDDAGTRPFFRLLHYLSLILVFLFVVRVSDKKLFIEYAVWGLFLAGLIHGAYAFYQQFADIVGLPYRGIVYSASGTSVAVHAGSGLRVNGLADEPKRLGYILFSATIIAAYFFLRKDRQDILAPLGSLSKIFRSSLVLLTTGLLLSIASLMTYSGSFFAAVALTGFILVLSFSARTWALMGAGAIFLLAGSFMAPDITDRYVGAIQELADSRINEFEVGLDGKKIYRQEFFAQDLVENNPMSLVWGVGLGRYNIVLYEKYGTGAGFGELGGIAPLNSQFFEIGFDIGLPGLVILFLGVSFLSIRIGRNSPLNFALSTVLIFLTLQSLFIDNKFYVAFVAATGCAWLNISTNLRRQYITPRRSTLRSRHAHPTGTTRRHP